MTKKKDLMVIYCARTYTPSLDDVGTYLSLYWVPTRVDGKCGKPLFAISSSPVIPGTVVAINLQFLVQVGIYFSLEKRMGFESLY